MQTNANSGYTLTVSDNAAGLQSASSREPDDPRRLDRQGDLGDVARRAQVRLHGDRDRRDDRRGVHRLEVRRLRQPPVSRSRAHATATGGTADTITIANRVAIDYTVPAAVYTDTITYTVTPNYT